MYILRGSFCERCGKNIIVDSFYDKEIKMLVVNGGVCEWCLKNVILPSEPFYDFVREFCREEGEEYEKNSN